MADYDIQIKGGTVVDGTRVPRYHGDVWIKDGKVAQIGGRAPGFAKKVIDAHDGAIEVHSEPGSGTEFALSIPLFSAARDTGTSTLRDTASPTPSVNGTAQTDPVSAPRSSDSPAQAARGRS